MTILYGEGATEEQAGEVEKYIHAKFGDDLEVEVINGGAASLLLYPFGGIRGNRLRVENIRGRRAGWGAPAP